MNTVCKCAFYIPARLADRLRCTRFGQFLRRTRLDELIVIGREILSRLADL